MDPNTPGPEEEVRGKPDGWHLDERFHLVAARVLRERQIHEKSVILAMTNYQDDSSFAVRWHATQYLDELHAANGI